MHRPLHLRRAGLCLLLVASGSLAACSGDDGDTGGREGAAPDGTTTTTEAPAAGGGELPGADWEVADPADRGFDPELLDGLREYAFVEDRNTQGVVVVHDGVIIGEWYAEGADAESYGTSWSAGKSFAGALIGIALDQGLIESVDEPMTTWYPEWADDERAEITLRDVLQMASGLEWSEPLNVLAMATTTAAQLPLAVDRRPIAEPGTTFEYSSADTLLLSGVIAQVTGMPAHEYAQQVLFDPLGMSSAEWWRDGEDTTLTYCCIDATSRDMARFGLLYLRDGAWGDEQLVSTAWVADSTTPSPSNEDYGYQWWLYHVDDVPEAEGVFAAQGLDGQYIYVLPELDVVVVRHGLYGKHDGEPVAVPNLGMYLPALGIVPGRGTVAPADWDDVDFLTPLVEAYRAGS